MPVVPANRTPYRETIHVRFRVVGRLGGLLPLAAVSLVAVRGASAQGTGTTFEVDPLSSIAWWQVVPHLNRLWATTCPEERSWLPPAGHDAGSEDASEVGRPTWKVLDTNLVPIPLLPRYRVRPVCAHKAVHGEIVAPDTVTWEGAHGDVSVDAAAITQGETIDDNYAHSVIYQVNKYPEIVLHIDSLVEVSKDGDTTRAVAVGTFSLHGVTTPLSVHVTAWHEAGGIRVKARWFIVAHDLIDTYHFSGMALGFGVGTYIWRQFWMGVDLVMRPEVPPS